jgi:CRISPR/Cas system-associated exonuclease Cas4 (RecB family)
MPPRVLSASQLTTFLMCARKWAFRYVEEAPPEFRSSALAFGSAVHSALEWIHLEKLEGRAPDPDVAARIFRADWTAETEGRLRWKEDEVADDLRDKGEALVRLYIEKYRDLSIRAAELPFEIDLVDPETGEVMEHRLRGYFDLLLPEDTLVEIKTSARRFDEENLRRRIQLSAYAYTYRRMYGRDPTITVVTLLKTKKPAIEESTTPRTKEDDAFFVHLASEVARGIDAGAFPPNPGIFCRDCEHQTSCAAWRGAVRPAEMEVRP